MKIIQINRASNLPQHLLGGKAYNLQRLLEWGLNVPKTYILTADNAEGFSSLDNTEIVQKITASITKEPGVQFAVRSSGVGEDGVENSFAGIFDTVLHVEYQDLPQAIRKVYQSKDTAVTSMYGKERKTTVSEMAVLIQEMVDADYAGVAFSVNPVEIDRRVGLIEIVAGVGESLVSGKTKPTSIRINKLTGMHRVLQVGTDVIQSTLIDTMVKEVGDLLAKVENLYEAPIDIEWAIKDNELHLLQARPITTLGDIK